MKSLLFFLLFVFVAKANLLGTKVAVGLGSPSPFFLPLTEQAAAASGWAQANDFVPNMGNRWTYTLFPNAPIEVFYLNSGKISGVRMRGPGGPILTQAVQAGFYRYVDPSQPNTSELVVDISFRQFNLVNHLPSWIQPAVGNVIKINPNGANFLYQSTATGAENNGWIEGGCFELMGGSHYHKFFGEEGDWFSNPTITPIYNKYGEQLGSLSALSVGFGEQPNPGTSPFYDFGGGNLDLINASCKFNFCGAPGCEETFQAVSDQIQSQLKVSGMHLLFFDPANPQEWGVCQDSFGACSKFVQTNPFAPPDVCSCCGTPSSPSGIRDCGQVLTA